MRYISVFILLLFAGVGVWSCKKYTDPKAVSDPRLTNHYCNDPTAVNYNWNFPGIADNTVCFYPTDLFQGVYELHDSVFFKTDGFFISADTIELTINKHSTTKMGVSGFCSSGDSLIMTTAISYVATLDTTLGDSTTLTKGQALCSVADTVNGTIVRDRINDSIIYVYFTVYSDTGVVSTHMGTAKLKYKK